MKAKKAEKRKILFEGEYLRVLREDTWEFVERILGSGIVIIVPVTERKTVILIDQYRIPLGKRVVEFPSGLVNDQITSEEETLESAARRELVEETGYEATEMKLLVSGPSAGGASSAIVTFFLATGLHKVSEGGGDETEDIRVHEVPASSVETWLRDQETRGLLVDPKVYAGLYLAEHFPQCRV